ncbi:uncharacterized protein LOC105291558 isoform X2 [Pteropus vampyrus]|uniref:Uncharacterized protein LOC105291558 isoform X2 n=1 Tax=Pteropus vampyrus TaxID=132908 RepID=A0A6P6CFE7_PTEVA|nr:uncharacterized protein LOC105291558 isoform X2 [Pteropus vampyrus]
MEEIHRASSGRRCRASVSSPGTRCRSTWMFNNLEALVFTFWCQDLRGSVIGEKTHKNEKLNATTPQARAVVRHTVCFIIPSPRSSAGADLGLPFEILGMVISTFQDLKTKKLKRILCK